MCLHTSNNSGIKRLDIRGEVGLKIDELDVGGLICDLVASKIIKGQGNMSLCVLEFLVEFFNPLLKIL